MSTRRPTPLAAQIGEVPAREEPVGQRSGGQRQGEADHEADDEGPGLGRIGEQAPPGDEGVARQGDAHDDWQRKQLCELRDQGKQRGDHQPEGRAADATEPSSPTAAKASVGASALAQASRVGCASYDRLNRSLMRQIVVFETKI